MFERIQLLVYTRLTLSHTGKYLTYSTISSGLYQPDSKSFGHKGPGIMNNVFKGTTY